ncbi:succinate--CoA ligase subunit alpha [Crocosphaera watsonii WH 8501]|uniref:CoA-binding n=5 Tax=Crocosphaera watsonii TaxID=263511 RepID=Q4BVT9_CROWT|nr:MULTISPECIES: CoA-binding protein [Crocosphaera]EAM48019.1 CoA-binding [Crocosphaera watsonii WH 8501]EHJ10633.1 Succinyl-CoA ligase [ADP-forming] alpha chain [Crocosphaera watsonii WH 0003]MCH2245765.1 CoA-binding protein [Crocosphaera sp.]CCQ51878.1 Succinyl-CoA ligase [ADP-forming] alpha chain [Crocosphaera watsonii WH 8502]CCQ58997.1 Succinyl-CoA ligase [ADP-forming] alpha chain [Crocosphaera watsonii WH 0005]
MKWEADSKVLIQGITHPLAISYAPRMKAQGTNIVAGITLDEETSDINDIPVFTLVEEAVTEVGKIDTSLIFSPPYEVLDAGLEAIAANIEQLVIVTAWVPPLDLITLLEQAKATNTFVLGSGSEGLLVPDNFWLGVMEPEFYSKGSVGIISRCDRLMDEVAKRLTKAGLGQSLAISLGADWIMGSNFEQWLQIMEEDDSTKAIVLLGQPYSSPELLAAQYIDSGIEKPVIAYLPGIQAPINRSFGDATSIIASQLSYQSTSITEENQTVTALKKAGVKIANNVEEIPKLVKRLFPSQRRKSRTSNR